MNLGTTAEELFRLTAADFKAVSGYLPIYLDKWVGTTEPYNGESGGKICSVCLAGAVMVSRLDNQVLAERAYHHNTSPDYLWTHKLISSEDRYKLQYLNLFRYGRDEDTWGSRSDVFKKIFDKKEPHELNCLLIDVWPVDGCLDTDQIKKLYDLLIKAADICKEVGI